ncbi:hypothetical protein Scep_013353 [Stephania cephalantha]|uniref:Glycosyltransferase n=1 Tax=Stephania cephalantha TaxID=152367 RepID=A0AAP0PAK1_9MAGN
MKSKAELIVVPGPGIGHLVPTIEFARALTQRDHRVSLTVLVMDDSPIARATPSPHHFASLISTDHLRLVQLPSLSPQTISQILANRPGLPRIGLLVHHYMPIIKDSVSRLVSAELTQLDGFILDAFTSGVLEIADELGMPSYVYYTSSAAVLGFMLHLPDLDSVVETESVSNSVGLTIPSYRNSVPRSAFPQFMFHKDDEGYKRLLDLSKKLRNVKGILVNSFAELESYAVDSIDRMVCESQDQVLPNVYLVGPMIDRTGEINQSANGAHLDQIMEFLDKQPRKSVIFLCFGSMGSLNPGQVTEIANGLERSGHRFLWALRRPSNSNNEGGADLEGGIPDGFAERTAGRGLVCGWAPQVRVLGHVATGCFVSHCGWNSSLESVWFGVPMLTWPLYAEQKLNAFELVRELGVAIEMRGWEEEEEEVTSAEEVERSVKCVMEGHVAVKMRERGDEMRELSRKAVGVGGSSYVSMGRFIDDLLLS